MVDNKTPDIDALLAQYTPEIRAAFLLAIQAMKDRTSLPLLTAAIQAGDAVKAAQVIGINTAAMRPVTLALEKAFEAGGEAVAATAPAGLPTGVFLFDVRNPTAEQWINDISSQLVTRITTEQLSLIRTAIQTGIANGVNPRTTALSLVGRIDPATGTRTGGIIGLTRPQEQYVSNARAELQTLDTNYFTREQRDKRFDSIVKTAIQNNKPLDADTVSRLTTRYSDKLLKLRGDTIARTESIAALNASQFAAYQQAEDTGAIKKGTIQKEWDSVGDNRVRHDHTVLDGTRVPLIQPFVAPDGSLMMFPGDTSMGASAAETINCRCVVRYIVDWFADLREAA